MRCRGRRAVIKRLSRVVMRGVGMRCHDLSWHESAWRYAGDKVMSRHELSWQRMTTHDHSFVKIMTLFITSSSSRYDEAMTTVVSDHNLTQECTRSPVFFFCTQNVPPRRKTWTHTVSTSPTARSFQPPILTILFCCVQVDKMILALPFSWFVVVTFLGSASGLPSSGHHRVASRFLQSGQLGISVGPWRNGVHRFIVYVCCLGMASKQSFLLTTTNCKVADGAVTYYPPIHWAFELRKSVGQCSYVCMQTRYTTQRTSESPPVPPKKTMLVTS